MFPDKIFMATSSPVALDMSRQIWTSLLLLFPGNNTKGCVDYAIVYYIN